MEALPFTQSKTNPSTCALDLEVSYIFRRHFVLSGFFYPLSVTSCFWLSSSTCQVYSVLNKQSWFDPTFFSPLWLLEYTCFPPLVSLAFIPLSSLIFSHSLTPLALVSDNFHAVTFNASFCALSLQGPFSALDIKRSFLHLDISSPLGS